MKIISYICIDFHFIFYQMVLHNKYTEDRFAQEFGIKVCNDLVSVPARVLPPPMVLCFIPFLLFALFKLLGISNNLNLCAFQLKYHDSGREKTCAPSVGQWNMINKVMPCFIITTQFLSQVNFVLPLFESEF